VLALFADKSLTFRDDLGAKSVYAELTGFSVLINGVAQVGSGEPITADGPSKFTALQATQHVNYYAHGCEPDHGVP